MNIKVILLLMTATIQTLVGQDSSHPAIKEVEGVKAKTSVFKKASRSEPVVMMTTDDAKELFEREQLDRLRKQVDFKQQVVMVFAWRGSGQDRLGFSVLESFPEQLEFKFTPGRTRDLRSHVKVFAVRKNVIWKGKPVGAKGILEHPIELKESQSGFAGVSGKIWTIEKDGSWRVQNFLNQSKNKPSKSGSLSEKEQGLMVSRLKSLDFAGLPKQMGKDPGVNARTVSLRYGKHMSTMIMRGGAPLPSNSKKATEKRFVQLVSFLKSLTTKKSCQ